MADIINVFITGEIAEKTATLAPGNIKPLQSVYNDVTFGGSQHAIVITNGIAGCLELTRM